MNHGIRTLGFCFFLFLLSFVGCATQPSAIPNAHPEKYRNVYLLKAKHDPREVAPRIADRLRHAGFDVREIFYDDSAKNGRSDAIKKAREFAAANSDQPAAVCDFNYGSLRYRMDWKWWSFESIEILFYDVRNGDLIFKTVKYNYNVPMPEDTELNRRFVEISDAFFPSQPNPFKIK